MAEIVDDRPVGVPDKDGWIKSGIEIKPQEEEDLSQYPYRKEAKEQFEKQAKDWPEGELTEGFYGDATNDGSLHVQYLFQPAGAGGLGFLEIDLYIGGDPVASFEALKKESMQPKTWRDEEHQIDGWIDWPSGFPDQNDYEQVSHCGALKDLRTVYWVQNNKTLVQIGTPAPETTKLREYADGVWQAVYGMGI